MFKIRPAMPGDINDLFELAVKMAPGITTFPPDKEILQSKISDSIKAFDTVADQQANRSFLLVLEDLKQGKVIGTAGVYNNIGLVTPFYSYKIIKQTQENKQLMLRTESSTLNLTNAFQGGTEVGTLLLDPEYGGLGLGKFLAKSRYLLIANFIELFNEPVFAELRGKSNDGDESPFWEAIGRHFFAGIDFDKADLLSATTDNQFIADLMPRYPIYIDLLPQETQDAIGKANRKGQAALSMLLKEGFRDEGYVDIFDAGATVVANFNDIITIRKSLTAKLERTEEVILQSNQPEIYIASTNLLDFSVSRHTTYQLTDNAITLDSNALTSLSLTRGQTIRYI